MEFEEILQRAKYSEKVMMLKIIEMYRPLLIKYSKVNGRVDEDLYQELVYTVLLCIKKFSYKEDKLEFKN